MGECDGNAQLPVQGINQGTPKLVGAFGVKQFSSLILLLYLKPGEPVTSNADFNHHVPTSPSQSGHASSRDIG